MSDNKSKEESKASEVVNVKLHELEGIQGMRAGEVNGKIVLEIDPKGYKPSSTGKSWICTTTGGNIVGPQGVTLNINAYRPPVSGEEVAACETQKVDFANKPKAEKKQGRMLTYA